MSHLTGIAVVLTITGAALAEWKDATGNVGGEKWGYAGVCLVAAVPDSAAVIAGVSEAGLWRSDDKGDSWTRLGADDREQIRNRPHQIMFDPKNPGRFWISGCYGAGVFTTDNGGRSFRRLGNLSHVDGIGVDFTDPDRKTLVVGLHEQSRSIHKSADGGLTWQKIGDALPEDSNHSTDPIVLDGRTFIVNTAGWAQKRSWGIHRTEDSGVTWTKVSELGPSGRALVASDGRIWWGLCYGSGLAVSADKGRTWKKVAGPARSCPIEIRAQGGGNVSAIAALGGNQIYLSKDGGETWEKWLDPVPFKPSGIAFSANGSTVYAWRLTEKKSAEVIARWQLAH